MEYKTLKEKEDLTLKATSIVESFLEEKSPSQINLSKEMVTLVLKKIKNENTQMDPNVFDTLLADISFLMKDSLSFHDDVKLESLNENIKVYMSKSIQEHLEEVKSEEITYFSYQNLSFSCQSLIPLMKKFDWENQESKMKILMIQRFFNEYIFQSKTENFLIFSKSAYSSKCLRGSDDFYFKNCEFGKNQEGLQGIVCKNYHPPQFDQDEEKILITFWFLLLEGKFQDRIWIGQCQISINKNLKIDSKVDEKTIWNIKTNERKSMVPFKLEKSDSVWLRAEFLTSGVESFIEEQIYPLPKKVNYIPVNKVDYMCYDLSPILKKMNWEKINNDQRMMIINHFFNNYIFKKRNGANLIFHEKSYGSWRISLNNEHPIEYYFHIAKFGQKHQNGDKTVIETYNKPQIELDELGRIIVTYWGLSNETNEYIVAKCRAIIDNNGPLELIFMKDNSWSIPYINEKEKEVKFSNSSDFVRLRAEFLYSTKISQFIKAYFKEYELVNYVPHEITEGLLAINCCEIFNLFNWKKLDKNTKLALVQHFFNNYIFIDNKEHTKIIIFTQKSYSSINQYLVFSTDYYFESCKFGKIHETINKDATNQEYSPPKFQFDENDNSIIIYYWTYTICTNSPNNVVARVKCRISKECKMNISIENGCMWLVKTKMDKLLQAFKSKETQ